MNLKVKICGIADDNALRAAVEGGAAYAGFVFYPRSPRAITIEAAQKLVIAALPHLTTVGLFVDPTDKDLDNTLRIVPLGMIQLHGNETPERVAAIRAMSGRPVMKAIGIGGESDLAQIKKYAGADSFLCDAKAKPGAIPGGTGSSFNWSLLANHTLEKPWMLAGGLTVNNLEEAVTKSGAQIVDVSSGVEDRPGHKSVNKIREFLAVAAKL